MQRFFAFRDGKDPRTAHLDSEEWRHARSVLRLKPGEDDSEDIPARCLYIHASTEPYA